MKPAVNVSARGSVGLLAIDNPPVNTLCHGVREGMLRAIRQFATRSEIVGIVIHGAGTCFSAGGDIGEFDTPAAGAWPRLSAEVHPAIENCGKTVVAALHGYALGGGLETAMACHARIAAHGTFVGLPEARIGVVPLSATQRLPRLVSAAAAMDMLCSGARYPVEQFQSALIDAVVDGADLLDAAVALARAPAPPLVRKRELPRNDLVREIAHARAGVAAGDLSAFTTPIIDAVEAGVNAASFDAGLAAARAIYNQTLQTQTGQAARATFFSRDRTKG